MKVMKGTYVLLIRLPARHDIRIGGLGELEFKEGYYAYVGSALNGLDSRINRHLKKGKKMHWHIDYLLQHGAICDVYHKPAEKKEECEIARTLNEIFKSIKYFGSSDCKCDSHLFYSERKNRLKDTIIVSGLKRRHQNLV